MGKLLINQAQQYNLAIWPSKYRNESFEMGSPFQEDLDFVGGGRWKSLIVYVSKVITIIGSTSPCLTRNSG